MCMQQQKMQIDRLGSDFRESVSRFQTLQKVSCFDANVIDDGGGGGGGGGITRKS